ncbi:MAG: CNNM domain-containing protein [Candidatus Brocadiia bacterium]
MLKYALLVGAVLMAAFYSGSETGIYCVNRLRVWLRARQGMVPARALQRLVSRPRLAISTMLVGTNIGIYVATAVCTEKLRHSGLAARADLYSSLIMPPILLIFAEVLPKSLFQHHAEGLMYKVVWPLRVSEWLFYPLSVLLRAVSALPQWLLGRHARGRGPVVTSDTVRFYINQGAAHGVLSSYQRRMAENIMRLRSVELTEALTPLEDVVMVSADASAETLRELLGAHRYSRVPVFEERGDNIVGVINVIDLATAEPDAGPRELVRDVLRVPRDASVAEALTMLRRAKQQFAVVTGEQGGAIGVVTVKDLVEEIVGELEAW